MLCDQTSVNIRHYGQPRNEVRIELTILFFSSTMHYLPESKSNQCKKQYLVKYILFMFLNYFRIDILLYTFHEMQTCLPLVLK